MIVVERTGLDLVSLQGVPASDLGDDGLDRCGRVVPKPWGHEIELARDGAISVTRLELAPGGETSMHCHPGKSALLSVAAGYCELESLRVIYKLKPGDMALIQPGAFHRIRTEGGATIFELETPPNKQDLVRLADRYGREGKRYERAGS